MHSRILMKTENQIVLDVGDGYKVRATAQIIGTFAIVAIDWEHPNYGYFADGIFWYKSMHMFEWDIIPIATWSLRYVNKKKNGSRTVLLEKFLKDYPEFKDFFDLKVSIWNNISL